MRPVPAKNPPNPFAASLVEYLDELGEAPQQELQIYEDHTQQILAKNDSPDLGFTFSINPYRGCFHGCAYCLWGETSVLMGDGSTKRIADVRVGDEVCGTRREGDEHRFVKARVLDHWATIKPAYRVRLSDGTELIASADHRFLSRAGWKYVLDAPAGSEARPSLRAGDVLLGRERDYRVLSIRAARAKLELFDIATETGDFIANGVISHNCYARPTHEYLSFGSGTDFERKIVVKPNAPALLRQAFEKPSWKGELIMLSGNTDCYQPLENGYRLTRGILEVCAEYRNPVHIITKSPLVERDLDVLLKLHAEASVGVSVSIPFWTEATARALEPFVTTPARRMKTVARLAEAGIPVTVNVAPLILGLGDRDVPKILEAAAAAGAQGASLIPLRLPGSVKDVFVERLQQAFPLSAEKVLRRTREMRGGKLYDSTFGKRMEGDGEMFEAVRRLFDATCRRLGLNQDHLRYAVREGTFRRPTDKGGQLRLFER